MQEYNYFIFGFDKSSSTIEYKNQVKILVSMRFRLFELIYDSIIVPVSFLKDTKNVEVDKSISFDLGYRQKSFWNLYDSEVSRPMYENNYSPSFYFTFKSSFNMLPYSVLFGYVHESNGEKDFISRGWERAYTGFCLGRLETNMIAGQLDFWYPFGLEDNEDIYKYCGIGQLSFYFQPLFLLKKDFSSLGLSAIWKMASKNLKNIELSLLLSPFQFFENRFVKLFAPTFYAQLYVGKGENLIDYDKRHVSVRIGLATLY